MLAGLIPENSFCGSRLFALKFFPAKCGWTNGDMPIYLVLADLATSLFNTMTFLFGVVEPLIILLVLCLFLALSAN